MKASESSTSGAGDRSSSRPEGAATAETATSIRAKAGRGALWAMSANLVMRFANIAITAVLARLLSPEDFGVFAVALAVYLVVTSLAELGMGSAVARSAVEPVDIAPTVVTISIAVSFGCAALLAVFSNALSELLGQPAAAQPLQILAISLALTGLFAVPGAQLVREFRQDRIFLATVVGFVVGNPVLVILALQGGGATAFAWSRVVGQLATGMVFWLGASRRYWPGWSREQLVPLLTFGLPLSMANLVNWTLLNADYMILGRLVSAAEVGVYMIAFNVASWSTAILGSVLNSVVVPAFGRVSSEARELRAAVVGTCRLVGLVSLPIGALSIGLAAPIVLTLFGEKWAESIPVLAILAVYGVFYGFTLLFVNVLVATGRTGRLLLIQLAWVLVLVPTMVFALHMWGLEGAAWAHVLTICLIALPGYLLAIVKATETRAAEVLAASLRPVVAAVAAGACAWLVALAFTPPWLRLGLGGAVGGIVYLAAAAPLFVPLLPSRFVPSWLPSRWRPVDRGWVA